MITVIRKHFKGTAYKSILWLTIFALVAGIFSVPILFRRAEREQGWAIKVNGYEVPTTEFNYEMSEKKEWIARQKEQYGQFADLLFASVGISLDPYALALDSLTREVVLFQTAEKMGLYLHPDYIAKQLQDPYVIMQELAAIIPPYVVGRTGLDRDMLKQFLKYKGMSATAFEEKIERTLASRIGLEIVAHANFIPEADIKNRYFATEVRKQFIIATFSLPHFIKEAQKKPVDQATLKSFFDGENKSKNRYSIPEKRTGTSWTFSPDHYSIAISADSINNYYEKHKSEFLESPTKVQIRHIVIAVPDASQREIIKQKAETIRKELVENPELFAQKATEYSTDKATAQKGGLLPFFARGEQPAERERAAFLLKENGAISPVIFVDNNCEIIQRVDKKMQTYKPLSQVKEIIKNTLLTKQFEAAFKRDAEQYGSKGKDQVLFNQWISDKKADKQPIKAQSSSAESEQLQHLFDLGKGEKAYYVHDNKGYVVELTDIVPSYLPSLESVKSQVTKDFYEQEAVSLLNNAVGQLYENAHDKDLMSFKQMPGITLEQTDWLNPGDKENNKKLEEKGIPVKLMLQIEKKDSAIKHAEGTTGYVIQLKNINEDDQKNYSAKKAHTVEELRVERSRLLAEGFVASLYRNATIETNNSMINSRNNIQYEN